MTCLPLFLAMSACGNAASLSDLISDQERHQRPPTIAQELQRLGSLSEPDQLILLIRSREHRPLSDFSDEARELIVALVPEPGFHSRDGVVLDRGWGEDSTVSIKVNTRIYLNELDGTFHEIEIQRPARAPGGQYLPTTNDPPSEEAMRLTERKKSARRLIERFRASGIVTNLLTPDDFLRKRTKFSDLSAADRDRLRWELSFGKAMGDLDAFIDLLADDERFADTSVRVSAQVIVSIADGSRNSLRAYSMP